MSDETNHFPGYPGYGSSNGNGDGAPPTPPSEPAPSSESAQPAPTTPPSAQPSYSGASESTPAAATAPTIPLPPAAAVPTTAPTAPTTAPAAPSAVPTVHPAPGFAPAGGFATPPTPPPAGVATAPRRSVALPVIAALAVGAVIGGGAGAGVAVAVDAANSSSTTSSTSRPQNVTINATKSVSATTAIAAKAGPSVVTIDVSSGSEAGTGSGVVLDTEGHVLTNTHVVTLDGETATGTIQVTTSTGELYSASVVGTDPTMDLAVIQLKNAKNLTPISFGDSDKLNVGDQVVAIGAPLGLANTVTEGIVSALNRSIEIASSAAPDSSDGSSDSGNGGSSGGPFDFWNDNGSGSTSQQTTTTIKIPVVQTDAAINPGNSGGALVDGDGKLVGVNVAIASTGSTTSSTSQSGSIGVGFAIPSDVAKRIAAALIADGKATHGLLGASVTDATAKTSSTVGAVIADTPVSGGAAANAGLQKGDVVTEFNGKPITDAVDLTAQVRALAGGASTTLTYTRDGKSTTVDVKLGTLQS